MPPPPRVERHDEAFCRDFLTRGDAMERRARRVFKRIPSGPRCKLCAAPFAGIGAPFMRMIGKRQSDLNPTMCSGCFDFIIRHHGGAEIDCTLLFADVRGSTAMAERMSPAQFRGRLDRFTPRRRPSCTSTTVVSTSSSAMSSWPSSIRCQLPTDVVILTVGS